MKEKQKDIKKSEKKAWFRVFVTYLSVVILSKNSFEVNKRQNWERFRAFSLKWLELWKLDIILLKYTRKKFNSHRTGMVWNTKMVAVLLSWGTQLCRTWLHVKTLFFAFNTSPITQLVCSPKLCITLVFISPGYYSRPKRNKRQCFCKIWGSNKVYYGRRENSEIFS